MVDKLQQITSSAATRRARLTVSSIAFISIAVIVWMIFADGLQHLMTFLANLIPDQSPVWFIGVFVALCILSLWLVVPSGSLLLIAAGFALGATTATVIYSFLQCLFCWPMYQLVRNGFFHPDKFDLDSLIERHGLESLQGLIYSLKSEPVTSSLVLRLTPIIPNAVACTMAPLFGIGFRPFFTATVLVCWVRPLFYTGVGASLNSLSQLRNPLDLVSGTNVMPLVVVFLAAIAILMVQIWLRHIRRRN